MSVTHVEISNVSLQFAQQETPILQGINFQVKEGEFLCIIGRSGCGKTSLLKMIGGLEQATSGEVSIRGNPVYQPLPEVSYIFQKPVLLEWRTLIENLLLPLELKRKLSSEDRKKALQMLELVGLVEHGEKYPEQCSGGMLSRAALARGLLTNPELLLMDEPFAALDNFTKEQLQLELMEIANQLTTTILFITHDLAEALFLADRIILLGGRPAQVLYEMFVPFPRPREKALKYSAEYISILQELSSFLEQEAPTTNIRGGDQ